MRPLLPLLLSVPLLAFTGCGARVPPAVPAAPETLHVATDDGWRLALHRYPPAAGAPSRSTPVVLCHGVMANLRNWDLVERLSLPRRLAAAGFDTYVLELRGGGASEQPGLFDEKSYDYTFDDYVLHDVPAAVDAVAARGRSGQVHWIGHSMGGMVMYGYLQRVGQARIRSLTAVASPPAMTDHSAQLREAMALFPLVDWLFDELPSGTATRAAAAFTWPPRLPAQRLLANFDDMAPDTVTRGAAFATENVSSAVVRQMYDARESGHLRSADGAHDYTAAMDRIEVPVYFLAGPLDHLAPPAVFYSVFDQVPAEDKRLDVFGEADGHSHDYGHLDLVLGESAPREVYPPIVEWVVAHD